MKKLFAAGLLALLSIGGIAFAQVSVPIRVTMAQNDLVQVVPNGQPSAQSQFATVGQVAGISQYSYQIPLTAFSITVANGTGLLHLNPAGTLATGTLTMSAAPSDGQNFCLFDSQTQTAITIAANTGQSLGGIANLTALVANTEYCWYFNKQTATWYRLK